jgi:ArsR family transcriptional regulator
MDSLTFAKAMADETRQEIMRLLCCRWLCVSDVVDALGHVSQPTVSHHLAVLRDAGLAHTRPEGRQVFYSLNQDAVAFCCGTLMANFAPERQLIFTQEIAVK